MAEFSGAFRRSPVARVLGWQPLKGVVATIVIDVRLCFPLYEGLGDAILEGHGLLRQSQIQSVLDNREVARLPSGAHEEMEEDKRKWVWK